ncbi:MFS transporter [Micromonospora sp. NPDC051141]|uniref:MFS transporter n=1 Tax=Micromonospora sp. NPDC051141 TaxID=3364284 RepID=UPI00379BF22B
MSNTAAPTAPSAASIGWRLGALYGPAIYGVSAAAVALPVAAGALHTSPVTAVWILTIHALGLGVGAAVAGRAIDLAGPRRTLSLGVLLLAAGAAICVVATVLAVAVAGRALLAAGSGTMTATALTLATGRPPPQRATVLARLGAVMALFSATAPLAGALAVTASWRTAMVLPALSLIALPLCWQLTPRHPTAAARVDWIGAALLATAAAGLLLTIQSATLHLPPPAVAGLVVGTCALAVIAGRHRRGHPRGFIAPVISQRRFLLCALAGAGIYGGLFACVYAVPQMLTRLGCTAETIGLLLLPSAFIAAAAARLAGQVTSESARRRMLAGVAAVFSVSMLAAGFNHRPVALLCATTAGFTAFALAQTTLTAAVTADLRAAQRGGAVGLLNLTFFVGGAVGASVCSVLWQPWGLPAALAVISVLPAVAAVGACAAIPCRPPTGCTQA